MNLSSLETRIAELPDDVRDRLRTDPTVRETLSRLSELTKALSTGEIRREDLVVLEGLQAEVTEKWAPRLEQVELEIKISVSSSSKVPVCLYCGTGFGLEDMSEAAQWARLRRHVEKLHRSEWLALTKNP